MLLVCIRSYLKSVLRYKYLILDTFHADTFFVYVSKDVKIMVILEAKRDRRAKKFGKLCPVPST
jgi:hypothetical protein